jgi:para-nitrobenzyl esterase
MYKHFLSAASLLIVVPAFAEAPAPAPAQTAAPAFSIEKTDIGTLLDTPATKAILDKHLPGFSSNPQVDMARSLTLKMLQQFSPENITDEKLAAIEADLSKLK